MFAKYRKFWLAAAGVAAVVGKVLADGHVDTSEWGELAIAAATAAGVLAVRNDDPKAPSGQR